jgi:hypothetical protein
MAGRKTFYEFVNVTTQHMTPTLRFRVIYKNNVTPTSILPLEGGG